MEDDDYVVFSDDYSTESDDESEKDKDVDLQNIPIKQEPQIEVNYMEHLQKESEEIFTRLMEDYYENLLSPEEKIILQNKKIELENKIYFEQQRQKFNESLLLPPPSDDHIANAMSPITSSSLSEPQKPLLPGKIIDEKGKEITLVVGAKGKVRKSFSKGPEPSISFKELDPETQSLFVRIVEINGKDSRVARLCRKITYDAPYSIVFVPKTNRRRGQYSSKKAQAQAMKAKEQPKCQRTK